MPLSVEKSAVVHCGKNQPNFKYTLNNRPISVVNSITDLGVIRSTSSAYTEHCQAAISKASRAAYVIRRAFSSRDRVLLWSAFQFYVVLIIMYCSPVWSPTLKREISAVERVQRRFTKCIYIWHAWTELYWTSANVGYAILTKQEIIRGHGHHF